MLPPWILEDRDYCHCRIIQDPTHFQNHVHKVVQVGTNVCYIVLQKKGYELIRAELLGILVRTCMTVFLKRY